jgi:hypothetical protein
MVVSRAMHSEMSFVVETHCFQVRAVMVEGTLLWEKLKNLMKFVMK